MSVRLSAYISVAPIGQITFKYSKGDFLENLARKLEIFFQSDNLHEELGTFYCCREHNFAIKAFLCGAQYFHIVDSDMWLNNTHITHCYFPNGKNKIAESRHSVTFYVHYLSSSSFGWAI